MMCNLSRKKFQILIDSPKDGIDVLNLSRALLVGFQRNPVKPWITCALVAFLLSAGVSEAAQCDQWRGSVSTNYPAGIDRRTEWMSDLDDVRDAMVALCNQFGSCHTACPTALPNACIAYGPVNVTVSWPQVLSAQMSVTFENGSVGGAGVAIENRTNPLGCKVFVSAEPPQGGQCGSSCNGVGHPIDPSDGASQPTPAPGTTSTILYESIRDDGQVISFSVSGSSIIAPPGINMKLQINGTGFAITDASDTVESYAGSGKLLSIAGRSGVVQTMGYDGAGRLSSVTDSFGHSLTLTYDSLGRLSTVTR